MNRVFQINRVMIFLLLLGVKSNDLEYVNIDGSCNTGKTSFPYRNEMAVDATIANSSNILNTISCNVWYNSSQSVLRVWIEKRCDKTEVSSIISTVLDEQGVLVLPGYIREAYDKISYPLHICPSVSISSDRNFTILLSALPLTEINIRVQVDVSILTERETKSLKLGYNTTSRLLVFDISAVQGKFDHFQVTVRSDEVSHEAMLFVSDNCNHVVNIDPQAMNFRLSRSTIHLTFTSFGRVTLSHASKPQIRTGRWYIGLFLTSKHHDDNEDFNKTVRVSVGFAGGIDGINFTKPISYMVSISILGGLIIAVFADFFLNPEYEHRFIQNLRTYIHSRTCIRDPLEEVDNIEMTGVSHSSTKHTKLASGSICFSLDNNMHSSHNTLKLSVRKHWPGFKNWGLVMLNWFRGDERSYAYTTAIVAISLLVGAVQFIVSNWQEMINSGNRDVCYYNEGCYRTTPNIDIPYNLIISNLPYVIHGLIMALSVSLREATCRLNERTFNVMEGKQSFSIMYAFAWSFICEGLFSASYHMCPSRMTFQFDSAFMFVICGLVIVAAFNSLQFNNKKAGKRPVIETKLYFFFVMPLLVLNYMGSIRDTEGFLLFQDALFYFMCILWIAKMFAWVFFRLMYPCESRRRCEPRFWCKILWLCVLFPIIMFFIGLYTVDLKKDWSIFFLNSCLAAVLCTVIGYGVTMCLQNVYKLARERRSTRALGRRRFRWIMYLRWATVNFHVIIYTISTMACWLVALYYFQFKPVTDKVGLASRSRELNAECILWEFFDYHDLWHILSSFALLLTGYLIIWCMG